MFNNYYNFEKMFKNSNIYLNEDTMIQTGIINI